MKLARRPFRNLYIHVPFCSSKCAYCAFYSECLKDVSSVEKWLDKIIADSEKNTALCDELDTVYLGGGTPTLLSPEQLEKLYSAIRKNFRISPSAEISTECNPESLSPEKAEVIASFANRVSMGVQSFEPAKRKAIGRHNGGFELVSNAVSMLKNAGISNIGLDLIYALPGQSLPEWRNELETALSLDINHISAYSLIIEDGTPFASSDLGGIIPDDAVSAEMWETTQDVLLQAGMDRYEISNYAKCGCDCRHNQNVWHGGTYLGLGPSACSFDGALRWTEVSPLNVWMNGVSPETDEIPVMERLREIFIMGLRTAKGWETEEFELISGGISYISLWNDIIVQLESEKLLAVSGSTVRPTPLGLLFWNSLAEEFF